MRELPVYLDATAKAYISYRKISDRWTCYSEETFFLFCKHCVQRYPDAVDLSQEMVDGWCAKRDAETNNTCRGRIYPIISFVRYLRKRGLTDISEPPIPRIEESGYIPHAFTEMELSNFFKACDEIPASPTSRQKTARKLTVPVFFRLLYSSGIRTNEARFLRVENVDLIHGVLDIQFSKGHNQHFVVLHDTMLLLMQSYDKVIAEFYPNRAFFFPGRDGVGYSKKWLNDNFRQMWDKYNRSVALPYELRHNYAVENINKWTGEGFDFDAKLVALSKSMGHSSIESTKYYYSLVPGLADIIESRSSDDEIIPEVDYASF